MHCVTVLLDDETVTVIYKESGFILILDLKRQKMHGVCLEKIINYFYTVFLL
jgi:hypothetical protein